MAATMAAMALTDLSSFHGDWSDSMGNAVRVWDGGRGTQVVLSKPGGGGKEIVLRLTKVGATSYQCGHYDMDEQESSMAQIVWRDKRHRDRVTVWMRKDPRLQGGTAGGAATPQPLAPAAPASSGAAAVQSWLPRPPLPQPLHQQQQEQQQQQQQQQQVPQQQQPQQQQQQQLVPQQQQQLLHHQPLVMDGRSGLQVPAAGPVTVAPPPRLQQPSPPLAATAPTTGVPLGDPRVAFPSAPALAASMPSPGFWSAQPGAHVGVASAGTGGYAATFAQPGSAPGQVWPPPGAAFPSGAGSGLAPPPHVVPPLRMPLPRPPVLHQAPFTAAAGMNMAGYQDPQQAAHAAATMQHQPRVASVPAGADESDWSHVLSVLAAARDEPKPGSEASVPAPAFTGTAASATSNRLPPGLATAGQAGAPAPGSPGGASDATKGSTEPDENDPGAARWSEVLELLTVAGGPNEGGGAGPGAGGAGGGAGATGGAGGQVAQLFSGFGLPQRAPVEELPSEELRAQVLQETLARLLQQKTASFGATAPAAASGGGAGQQTTSGTPAGAAPVAATPQLWDGSATLPSADPAEEEEETGHEDQDIPDWKKGGVHSLLAPKAVQAAALKEEHPLQKFIRIFGLDELAAKCLRALEDDEVAFVIESCQGRLRYAKNPSAVVMIAIKGVASKVGRRYYGNRSGYNSELQRLLEAHSMGRDVNKADKPLEIFMDSPEAEGDEADGAGDEGDVVDLEEAEPESDLARDAKRRKTQAQSAIMEVTAASPAVDDDEGEEDDDDGLFFVDTGGK